MLGRACMGKAPSPAATRTGPVRRSSIESAIAARLVEEAADRLVAFVSRGVPTGSSIHASSANSPT